MYDKKITKTYTKEGARPKLEKYCAYQERSHKQVYEKCRSCGLSEADANELLGGLEDFVYLVQQPMLVFLWLETTTLLRIIIIY